MAVINETWGQRGKSSSPPNSFRDMGIGAEFSTQVGGVGVSLTSSPEERGTPV